MLAAFSCEKEAKNPEEETGKVTTTISVSLPEASMVPAWKAGDKVLVNGVTSEALDSKATGKKTASFVFPGQLGTPHYAAYPVSAFSDYQAGSATVTLPSSQKYVAGSYDSAAFVMGAKSTERGKAALTPLVSLIHLNITGSASVSKIKVSGAEGAALSGAFTTNFVKLTGNSASRIVELNPTEAVALPAQFFICVPAGLKGDLTINVFDADGGAMGMEETIQTNLAAGGVHDVPAFEYEPSGATYDIEISAEGITSSTAVICWDNSPTAAYTISVFSDAGCATLVDSYAVDAGNACWGEKSPRFCISGLAPGTPYYVKVDNEAQDMHSNVLEVTTSEFTVVEASSTAAAVGDVILAEDFGELRWDCDMIGNGAGWFPTEAAQASFSTVEVGSFQDAETSSEKQLSAQASAIAQSRLAHWAQGENPHLYIHPGYLKLVGQKKVTHIVTPALDNIPEGKIASVEVELTASAYYSASSESFCTTSAIVAVQTGSLNEMTAETKTNTLNLSTNVAPVTLKEESAWNTYKVTLNGVRKGNRIAFGAAGDVSENDARMNLSDIKVTIKALEDAPSATITASLKSVSSSAAAFAWTFGNDDPGEDTAAPYTAAIYSDSGCNNLVVSHDFEASESCWDSKSPCFSFGGLAPASTYYFRVTDTAGNITSNVVEVTTAAFTPVDASKVSNAAVGDVILAEDFSEIGWGPDEFAGAAGFIPSPKNLNAPSGVNPDGSYTVFDNQGHRIFGTGIDLGDSRLSHGWGFHGNSATYLRNAYLRVATSTGRTHIVTPALAGIPEGKLATIEVTVTAARYESSDNEIAVFVDKDLSLSSETDQSSSSYRKYSGVALENGHSLNITAVKEWETKSVTIENVDCDNQLVIGSLEDIDGKNRFYISDVKVTIAELTDDPNPVFRIKDEASFLEFVSAVAAGDKTLDAKLTASLNLSAATVEAFETIEDYAGNFNGNRNSINGLTKSLFNDLKGTVSNLTVNSTLDITTDREDIGILANIVSGTVSGCTSKGSVTFNVAGGVTKEHRIGGLAGSVAASDAVIKDCTNEASVTNATANDTEDGELIIGGVVGSFWGTKFSITDCENTGAITNTAHWNKTPAIGGIIGQGGNGTSSSSTFTIASCSNSGAISNSGATENSIQVGGIAGFVRFATMTSLSNSGTISNSGVAASNVCVGGLLGFVDKTCTLTETKATNSGDVSNTGSGKMVSIGGILGRNSSGYLNATGTSSNYLSNSGTISDSSSTDADDLSIGGIVGYTTTGIKLQYARNTGAVQVLGGTRDTDVEIGGIGGFLNNNALNVNNCRNYGDITVSATITGDLFAGGIVGLYHVNHTTDKYNLWFVATIDTHLATVSGENYTAGLFGAHSSTNKATYLFNGLRFDGTVIGNKTKAGLLCNSRNASTTATFKGTCYIAPGSSRQYTDHTDTVNTDEDLTMDIICGYQGSSSAVSGVSVSTW